MMTLRMALSMSTHAQKGISIVLKQAKAKTPLSSATISLRTMATYNINQVSKNMHLITSDKDVRLDQGTPRKVITKRDKPLAIILPWLMAQQKHVLKYGDFYIDQGFDVLTVQIRPWQLLWPVKGSQVLAGELVDFLQCNYSHEPLLLHGFSVAGYLWGEVCVKMNDQIDLYQPILDRIVGQIWDSAADITEIPVGFPHALFPRNKILQRATEKYIRYHMRTFHDVATCHYIRSSQMFHTNLVKAPALFLLSKTDPIGAEESNRRVADSWTARGVTTYWKCWDRSPHVGHFRKHPKEYAGEIYTFLDRLSLVQHPEKIRAKL